MKFAVSALKNEVEGSRVAEVAVPHDQGTIGLDHLERVGTITLYGHRGRRDCLRRA